METREVYEKGRILTQIEVSITSTERVSYQSYDCLTEDGLYGWRWHGFDKPIVKKTWETVFSRMATDAEIFFETPEDDIWMPGFEDIVI